MPSSQEPGCRHSTLTWKRDMESWLCGGCGGLFEADELILLALVRIEELLSKIHFATVPSRLR